MGNIQRRMNLLALAIVAGAMTVLANSSAQASVKEIFEKHNLLGVFAWDCSKPPAGDNNYFVNRAIDADHIQRDLMTGPTTRSFYIIIDQAFETAPNTLVGKGTWDGQPTEGTWRLEQNRMLQWSATHGSKQLIADGKWLETGKDMPWLNRCGGQ